LSGPRLFGQLPQLLSAVISRSETLSETSRGFTEATLPAEIQDAMADIEEVWCSHSVSEGRFLRGIRVSKILADASVYLINRVLAALPKN
jgi:hypothetical protein